MQLRDWYQYIATEFDAEHDPAAAVSEGDQEAREAGRIAQLLMVRSYEALTIAAASQKERGLQFAVAEYIFTTQRAGEFVRSAELRVIGDCIIGQDAATLYELVHSDAGRTLLGLAEAVYSDAAQLEIAERRAAVVDLPTDHVGPLINLVERFVRLDPESGAPVAAMAATTLAQVGRGGACLYVLGDARYRHGDLGGARQSLSQAILQLEREGNVPGLLDALARMVAVESASRIETTIEAFGINTTEAGWRLALTNAHPIPLDTTGLRSAIVTPPGRSGQLSINAVAEIDVNTIGDRWLTWAFKRGGATTSIACSIPA